MRGEEGSGGEGKGVGGNAGVRRSRGEFSGTICSDMISALLG